MTSTEPLTTSLTFSGAALIILALTLAILQATGGVFAYSLDDPYIHLALARNLPGHYGVTSAEAAAASSSLLYPWLLVPFAHLNATLAPLILNLLACLGIFAILLHLERQCTITNQATPLVRAACILFFAAVINLFSLPFMGMEHSFHLLTTLLVFAGLLDWQAGRPFSRLFWLALILGPLFRLEALALSLMTVGLLLLYPAHRYRALFSLLLILLPQLLHALFLHQLGLPWLPGSALIKLSEAGPLFNFRTTAGWIVLTLTLALAGRAWQTRQPLLLIVAASSFAHLLFGRFGWLDRYHAYILALDLLTLIFSMHGELTRFASRLSTRWLFLVLFLGIAGISSFRQELLTPAAARDIWLQPVQIARFTRDFWPHRLGANDIGALSWYAPDLTTDLYGLGSEEARSLIRSSGGWTPASLTSFAQARHLDWLAIHDRLFAPALNPAWTKLAELRLQREGVLIDDAIQIYSINPALQRELEAKLRSWSLYLPEGVTLHFFPQP